MWRDTCKGALIFYIEDTRIKNGPTSRVRCWTTASGAWRAHLVSSRAPRELLLSSRPGRTAGPAAQTYHSAIYKGHAGAESDNPAGRRRRIARAGENCSFVALRLDDPAHRR